MKDGDLVIVGTGQAGSVVWVAGDTVQVLLRNGEIWHGPIRQCRIPQDDKDLLSAPIDVQRPEPKRKR